MEKETRLSIKEKLIARIQIDAIMANNRIDVTSLNPNEELANYFNETSKKVETIFRKHQK